jgi:hypothetical protein
VLNLNRIWFTSQVKKHCVLAANFRAVVATTLFTMILIRYSVPVFKLSGVNFCCRRSPYILNDLTGCIPIIANGIESQKTNQLPVALIDQFLNLDADVAAY